MATSRQYAITNSPSKFDLMVALFDNKPVEITVEEIGILSVQISSVAIEGATPGEWHEGSVASRWLIKGFIREVLYGPADSDGQRFSGLLDSRVRKGWLELTKS